MTRERAKQLRALIEKAAAGLTDAEALEGVQLFEAWAPERDGEDDRTAAVIRLSEIR